MGGIIPFYGPTLLYKVICFMLATRGCSWSLVLDGFQSQI